jgi:hypothetical protein
MDSQLCNKIQCRASGFVQSVGGIRRITQLVFGGAYWLATRPQFCVNTRLLRSQGIASGE